MTPNDNVSNHSHSDASAQSPAKDRTPANTDTGVSRREFLGATAASLLMAGTLRGAGMPDSRNGFHIERSVALAKRFR